ncbi:hypothetical protein M378DRAFT_171779 [Amanita muscaria Koide BX008]|uniref:Uncharacterized protein n=1 Tax=Amanita muscaria (strain Koide BX008) TaxID=946122 RepID=A0A0C2WL87_AMAMK|nr:hypothetical protein M378DRAFT_171779 [Amanita muscaria Koide BX008]
MPLVIFFTIHTLSIQVLFFAFSYMSRRNALQFYTIILYILDESRPLNRTPTYPDPDPSLAMDSQRLVPPALGKDR